MDRNLGKFIVDDIVLPKGELYKDVSETVVDRVKNITLYFSEVNTPVCLTQIKKIELLPNKNIFVEGCLFSPALYNAYVEHYTIRKLVENGLCLNPINHNNTADYMTEYYNYRFKEFSVSRTENNYLFILEPIEEDI